MYRAWGPCIRLCEYEVRLIQEPKGPVFAYVAGPVGCQGPAEYSVPAALDPPGPHYRVRVSKPNINTYV